MLQCTYCELVGTSFLHVLTHTINTQSHTSATYGSISCLLKFVLSIITGENPLFIAFSADEHEQ